VSSTATGEEVIGMTKAQLAYLVELEGHHVCVALSDGSRLDDCELVSIPRRMISTVWLYVNGEDRFVGVDQITDVWKAA
jgi:hypothetical protein